MKLFLKSIVKFTLSYIAALCACAGILWLIDGPVSGDKVIHAALTGMIFNLYVRMEELRAGSGDAMGGSKL